MLQVKDEQPPEPDRKLTEIESVFAHRYLRLMAIGLASDEAIRLMGVPDIAAEAECLHARGCPPRLIVDILT